MAYIDLIMNLALLVALSVLSGFVDRRWPKDTFAGVLLQGFLFGVVAIIGMLRPLVLGPGLIFDGRSIIISLCALFFGHPAVSVTATMAAAYRLALGGPGMIMGVSAITASAVIGLLLRHKIKPETHNLSTTQLYFLGLAVHAVMVALMFTLPGELAIATIKRLWLPVIILYPLATVLAGKILSDQFAELITTKKLHESETSYRLMLESAPYAVFIQTEERFSYINPAGLRLFGASSPSDIIGRSVYERFHPDYIDIVRERIKHLNIEHKNVPVLEQKYIKMDGSAIDVEVSAVPFVHQGKNGALVFVKDISDRKNTENALRESENLYRKLFENHAAVKLLIDPETAEIVDANFAAEKFYGWPREKLKQMKITEINTLSPAEVKQEMEKARAAEKIYFEFRHRLADGSTRNVEVYSSKINVKGKDLLHSIIHDITARKQAEEKIKKNESFLEDVFASIQDGMSILEPSLTIRRVNKIMNKWYSETVPLEGKKCYEAYHKKDKPCAPCPTLRCLKTGKTEREIVTGPPASDVKWIELFSYPMKDPQTREITGVVEFVRNITARKQAEEEAEALTRELERRVAQRTEELHKSQMALLNVVEDVNENAKKLTAANAALEAINKELEAFAYSVSHDLRAPLRSIDGFSAALLEDYGAKLDKTGKDYLARVRRAAQHMGKLIDDLLKLSRVSKADFRPEPVNMSSLAKKIFALHKEQTGSKNINIKIQDDIIVSADAALMEVALANLVDNAFKFTGKQENPLIEFGVKNEAEQNVFYLRDNGAGFDMKYADKLFGPFQRLHALDEFEGTGIGLATVQRIIHRHGGKVWAQGEVGKGATFFFTIPEG